MLSWVGIRSERERGTARRGCGQRRPLTICHHRESDPAHGAGSARHRRAQGVRAALHLSWPPARPCRRSGQGSSSTATVPRPVASKPASSRNGRRPRQERRLRWPLLRILVVEVPAGRKRDQATLAYLSERELRNAEASGRPDQCLAPDEIAVRPAQFLDGCFQP